MKIKNSVKSISPDVAVVLMCLCMLVTCPLRIFQMLKNIEPATGFYNNYGSISVIILYALLVVFAFLILLLTFLSGRVPAALAPGGRRIPLALSSLVFSATLFYDALSAYISKGEATATIVQNIQSISKLRHAHSVLALLAGCYFLIFFISYISGNNYHKKLKLLALAPLGWTIVKILERITVIISIMRVSELFLELLALVFLMIFFMVFARVVSEVNCKGSMWSVIACGCVASMIILTYSIPRLMLMVSGNSDMLVSGYPLNYSDLGSVLFILIFIITTLRKGYTVEDVEAMNAELAHEEEAEAAERQTENTDAPFTPNELSQADMYEKKTERADADDSHESE